jgi:hypothetical protein
VWTQVDRESIRGERDARRREHEERALVEGQVTDAALNAEHHGPPSGIQTLADATAHPDGGQVSTLTVGRGGAPKIKVRA